MIDRSVIFYHSAADLYILNNFPDVAAWKDKVIRIVYHGRRASTIASVRLVIHGDVLQFWCSLPSIYKINLSLLASGVRSKT